MRIFGVRSVFYCLECEKKSIDVVVIVYIYEEEGGQDTTLMRFFCFSEAPYIGSLSSGTATSFGKSCITPPS